MITLPCILHPVSKNLRVFTRLKCQRCQEYVRPKCNCRERETAHNQLLQQGMLGTTKRLEDTEVWHGVDNASVHGVTSETEAFMENKKYDKEWVQRKHNYVRHYNCNCQRRERRDNQLAREGKLPVTKRLEEEYKTASPDRV